MHATTAPPAEGDSDWTPIRPFPGLGTIQSFVSGDPSGPRIRVAYFQRARDRMLVGRAWFGPGSQGPPGHVHGGAVAAVLDEAMGAAAWLAGHPSVGARIEVDYRAMMPLGLDAIFEAGIASVNGRKIATYARLLDTSGSLLAKSEGLFIRMTDEQAAAFASLRDATAR